MNEFKPKVSTENEGGVFHNDFIDKLETKKKKMAEYPEGASPALIELYDTLDKVWEASEDAKEEEEKMAYLEVEVGLIRSVIKQEWDEGFEELAKISEEHLKELLAKRNTENNKDVAEMVPEEVEEKSGALVG